MPHRNLPEEQSLTPEQEVRYLRRKVQALEGIITRLEMRLHRLEEKQRLAITGRGK
jgi:ubiquinone biosynthesis protein UbiJ